MSPSISTDSPPTPLTTLARSIGQSTAGSGEAFAGTMQREWQARVGQPQPLSAPSLSSPATVTADRGAGDSTVQRWRAPAGGQAPGRSAEAKPKPGPAAERSPAKAPDARAAGTDGQGKVDRASEQTAQDKPDADGETGLQQEAAPDLRPPSDPLAAPGAPTPLHHRGIIEPPTDGPAPTPPLALVQPGLAHPEGQATSDADADALVHASPTETRGGLGIGAGGARAATGPGTTAEARPGSLAEPRAPVHRSSRGQPAEAGEVADPAQLAASAASATPNALPVSASAEVADPALVQDPQAAQPGSRRARSGATGPAADRREAAAALVAGAATDTRTLQSRAADAAASTQANGDGSGFVEVLQASSAQTADPSSRRRFAAGGEATAIPVAAAGALGANAVNANSPSLGNGNTIAQAHVPVPLDDPGFGAAIGARISVMAKDGVHTARLSLNPAEMGPVTVQIAVNGQAARVDFLADVAATRSALEASLPALASAMREAGLTLSGGGVMQPGPSTANGQTATQAGGAAADASLSGQAGQSGQQDQARSQAQANARWSASGMAEADSAALMDPTLRSANAPRRGLLDLVA